MFVVIRRKMREIYKYNERYFVNDCEKSSDLSEQIIWDSQTGEKSYKFCPFLISHLSSSSSNPLEVILRFS